MSKIIFELDRAEAVLIAQALNTNFHEANNRLNSKEPLGDIEKVHLEYQKEKSKEIADKYFEPYF